MSRTQDDRKARLLTAAFANGPVFRMGFDAHVRTWRRHTQSEASFAYLSDPTFAAQCDARTAELRNLPMPAWKFERVFSSEDAR
jgi:hypothetical protein